MPTLQLIPNRCSLTIIQLVINNIKHNFIVDTGATSSCIVPELLPALSPEQLSNTSQTYHIDAGGAKRVEREIPCQFRFAGVCLSYIIVSQIGHNLSNTVGIPLSGLIGQDLLRMFKRVIIDYTRNTIEFIV